MKTIYLVRHAEVVNPNGVFSPASTPLSEQGVRQAEALATWFGESGIKPERIIASPHTRTRETAEIIALAIDGSVETDERLVEWKVGDWIGKPLAEFRRAAGYDNPPPFHLTLEGVETFEDMSQRVVDTILAEVARLPENGTSLIVSHREPLASGIIKLRNEPDWRNIPLLDIPKPCAWKLEFDGTSLSGASKAFDTSAVN